MTTLVVVAPGHQLAPAPAASYARMRAAGCPAGITSSYRSSTEQARLRALYLAGRGAFALPPGSSQHERGYALDLKRAAAAWVRAHPEYGWRFTNPNEWWHVDYFPVLDVAEAPVHTGGSVTPAPAPVQPAPLTPSEEDDMFTILWCYEHILGRAPAAHEVIDVAGALSGRSAPDVMAWFLAANVSNERDSVRAAYAEYLGRPPAEADIDSHAGRTVAQMRNLVAASDEAKRRR